MMRNALALVAAITLIGCQELAPEAGSARQAVTTPFTWKMAGLLSIAYESIPLSPAEIQAHHFSYVGQYGVNGCANNTAPYSCASNGCAYPGNPNAEILSYTALRDWLLTYKNAGLYVGLWGATYNNIEAEAHCFAEVANTLKNTYGVTIDFFDVDGEKSYETNQGHSQRFVDEFNKTLTFSLHKAYTPECHNAVPMTPWLNGGFTSIMPMAYWNDYGLNPAYCLQWLYDWGVPKDKAQVMLDGYKHGTPITWTQYAQDIQSKGAQGLSIWLNIAPSEWTQWKSILETYPVAVYDGSGTPGCTNECTSGARRCLDSTHTQVCGNYDADSCTEWGGTLTCASGSTCSSGNCSGGCTDECGTSGEKRCVDGDVYEECGNWDSDSCREWTRFSCGTSFPGTTCSQGYCVGCSNECTSGATRCTDSLNRQTCGNHDGDGCTEWGPNYDCGAAKPGDMCWDGTCVKACGHDCTAGARQCLSAGEYQLCANHDTDDVCNEWGPGVACGPGMTCSSGECACADECTSGAKRCIDETTAQSCGNFDSDSCREWGPELDCPATRVCAAGSCVAVDAGSPTDAGVAPADAGSASDAGFEPDASVADGGVDEPPLGPGCAGGGCQSTGLAPSAFLLLGLVLRRRRTRPGSAGA